MINIVNLSSDRYLVDVGMNAKGPLAPLRLREEDAPDAPILSLAPRIVRLIKEFLPESVSHHPTHKCWQLEQRYGDRQPWISVYAFSDVEFIPADFLVMNWYVNHNPKSWFTHKITIGKMLLSEDMEEIVGDLTLYERVLKKRVRGHLESEIVCHTEEERVCLLQECFGVQLNARQRSSIFGTMSEIT